MGLAAQFETIVHKQLNLHAAWTPVIIPYKLGDYGLISDGVFQKLGNIKDDFNVSFTEGGGEDATLNFVSESTTVVDASTGATVNLSPQGEIKANVTYKFNREKSFLVKAPVINAAVIQNVNQVAQQLKKVNGWRKKHIIVYQVYTAQNPLIISTVEGGTEVTLDGEGSALKQFNVGGASAKFSLKTTKGLALDITGKTGPIALGLFKLHWLSGNTDLLGADDEVKVVDLNGQELTDDL